MHLLYIFNSCIYFFVVLFFPTEKEARRASSFFAEGVRSGWGDIAYQEGDILKYNNTLVNPGGHYCETTGVYSCETSGIYYFIYSVYGWRIEDGSTHSRVSASLMKDSVKQSVVYFSNHNKKPIYITLSQSLVLQCNAGQKVWIESTHNNTYIHDYSYRNVFAGILLFIN